MKNSKFKLVAWLVVIAGLGYFGYVTLFGKEELPISDVVTDSTNSDTTWVDTVPQIDTVQIKPIKVDTTKPKTK